MHWAPSFLSSHSILSSPFRGHAFSAAKRFGGFLCIGTFSVFWQLQVINLGVSSIALSNYIHLNLAYCSQSSTTPLTPCNHKNINNYCRSDWRDQGPIDFMPGHLWMWKNVLIFTVKNMLKFEHFWKCRSTPEMYLSDFYIPVNIRLWVGGGRAATQTFASGGKYPRTATEKDTRPDSRQNEVVLHAVSQSAASAITKY